jgi:hypothetical protein
MVEGAGVGRKGHQTNSLAWFLHQLAKQVLSQLSYTPTRVYAEVADCFLSHF